MIDIAERLRAWITTHNPGDDPHRFTDGDVGLYLEAADEIERLRGELETELKSKALARQFSSVGMIGALETENSRLREILRIIWVAYQDNDGIRKIFHEAGFPWPEWERVWTP